MPQKRQRMVYSIMIKREMYMSRIRPFIGTELIKVMTGIRRCGKSVMLELIKQELTLNTFSAASLARFLKSEQRTVAPETILNYIRYC